MSPESPEVSGVSGDRLTDDEKWYVVEVEVIERRAELIMAATPEQAGEIGEAVVGARTRGSVRLFKVTEVASS